jgi:hypothetical protein
MEYLETSAKSNENVKDAFVNVAAKIMNRGLKAANPTVDKKPLLTGTPKKEDGVCNC